jgi:hypothetical protein
MLPSVTLPCMANYQKLNFKIAGIKTRINKGFDNRYMFDVVVEMETQLSGATLMEQLALIILVEHGGKGKNRVTQIFCAQDGDDFRLRSLSSAQAANWLCGEPTASQRSRAKQELREAIEKALYYKLPK